MSVLLTNTLWVKEVRNISNQAPYSPFSVTDDHGQDELSGKLSRLKCGISYCHYLSF